VLGSAARCAAVSQLRAAAEVTIEQCALIKDWPNATLSSAFSWKKIQKKNQNIFYEILV
jgi:hypothetical protein